LQARQYMNFVATDSKIAYLHLCEGAARLENGEISSSIGKLISYLVSDFLKAHGRMR
jgi:formiminoglutamase